MLNSTGQRKDKPSTPNKVQTKKTNTILPPSTHTVLRPKKDNSPMESKSKLNTVNLKKWAKKLTYLMSLNLKLIGLTLAARVWIAALLKALSTRKLKNIRNAVWRRPRKNKLIKYTSIWRSCRKFRGLERTLRIGSRRRWRKPKGWGSSDKTPKL